VIVVVDWHLYLLLLVYFVAIVSSIGPAGLAESILVSVMVLVLLDCRELTSVDLIALSLGPCKTRIQLQAALAVLVGVVVVALVVVALVVVAFVLAILVVVFVYYFG